VINEHPEDMRGPVYLGKFLAGHGRRDEALKEFNRALKRNPTSFLALSGKAEFLEEENPPKSLDMAIKIYQQIVEEFQGSDDENAKDYVQSAQDRVRYCEARKLSLLSRKYMVRENNRQLKKA